MKKMLLVTLLGLGLVLTSGQRASAWSKSNFGVGLNIGYEGGGNSVFWGMFKGEQPPIGGMVGEPEPAMIPDEPAYPAYPAPAAMPSSVTSVP